MIATQTLASTATLAPSAWAEPARERAFNAWLQGAATTHSLNAASVHLASADASFRRYFRIDRHPVGSCIIMDAPPDKEDCRAFVQVARLMADAGLSAPRVLAWDQDAGFMLLSDLGAQTMMEAIAPPPSVDAIAQPSAAVFNLYSQATDALVRWQLSSKPGVLPPYVEVAGRSQAAWSGAWWQWALSQGTNTSPLLDRTGANANVRQYGDVYPSNPDRKNTSPYCRTFAFAPVRSRRGLVFVPWLKAHCHQAALHAAWLLPATST